MPDMGAAIIRAREWRDVHKYHVKKLVSSSSVTPFPPCRSDMMRPELWKAGSWKWLECIERGETTDAS